MSDEKDSLSEEIDTQILLREELMGRLSSEDFGLKKREVSVMTRMSNDIVDILDALVELEIFKSRSEVVAAFVQKVIQARHELFEEIRTQADDIRKQRDAAKHLAFQVMKDNQDKE